MTLLFALAVALNALALLAPLLIGSRWLSVRRARAQRTLTAAFAASAQTGPPPFPTDWSRNPAQPRWWAALPEAGESFLFQLPGGGSGCAWRSARRLDGRLLLFGKWRGFERKSAPPAGDLPAGVRRSKLGTAAAGVHAYADDERGAAQLLNASGLVAAFIDADLLGTLRFCYLRGWGVLLNEAGEVVSRDEAAGLAALTLAFERALNADYLEPDGRLSCAWAEAGRLAPGATPRLCPTPMLPGSLRVAAWFAFPYLGIFAPVTGLAAQLQAMPLCLAIAALAGFAVWRGHRLARRCHIGLAQLVGKDSASDSDGTAYWLILRHGAREDRLPVLGTEWEAARPDWQLIVLIDPLRAGRLRYPWQLAFLPCPYGWRWRSAPTR